jgi:putative ABC transport system permease protein
MYFDSHVIHNAGIMIRNYLLSLYRNITRNKFYSFLNIAGLSVGMASATFILLYVQDELSFDKYHVKHERIYRIEADFSVAGKHDQFAVTQIPMGPALKIEFPEVEEFCRFFHAGNPLFRAGEKEYYENSFYFADSTVFDIFTYEMIRGNAKTALTEPNSIVLTATIAQKYFGNSDPTGEMIQSGSGRNYKVTGVMKDQPSNSHLRFDALISGSTLARDSGTEDFNSLEPVRFWNVNAYTYILVKENATMQNIHDKFPPFYEKYMKPVGDQINAGFNLLSTPLAGTHFRKGLGGELPTGNKAYIYIFSSVALFLLLLAAINYMNMATARSANRAKEVGMRKVVGAYRRQLVRQFISESVIIALIAMFIAILLVTLFMPEFNTLSGKELSFSTRENPLIYLQILAIALVTGVISGSYPAFYLSSFKPVTVLKGTLSKGGKNAGLLRRSLVIIQFFIATLMIIVTIAVSSQIRFLKNKDLGFDKSNLLVMTIQDTTFRRKADVFKQELLQHPGILSATSSTGVPGETHWMQVLRVEKEDRMAEHVLTLAQTDHDYVDVFNLEIIRGRNFDRNMATDQQEAVIVNETAVRELGWGEDPIGKKIHYGWELDGTGGRMMKVTGVVKDFHFRSLHNKIEPIIYFLADNPAQFLTCRINPGMKAEAIETISSKWEEFQANRPFDYYFLDEHLDEMYQSEEKISMIILSAAIITIYIALLGLLGLSSFVTEQRTREIGIRKVAGASVLNILRLFYKEFIALILVAFLLAIPIAWWQLDIWLESNFVYYRKMHWSWFLQAGMISFVMGMATISYYITKTATSNPVNSIRSE